MKFIEIVIKYGRIFTLLVVLLPIVAGVYAYQTLPKEGEPEISAPIALVITTYSGASPAEIESLVTNPIEEALSNLKDLKEMRSSSAEGASVVVCEFDVDADVERSLQRVREKVTDARSELPEGADDPQVEEINLTDVPILIVSVVGDVNPIRLKKLAEDVADELELLPEVLSTDVTGGQTREIQIYCDPDRLSQYGLTILDVFAAVKLSDVNIPGGMVDVSRRRFLLRTLTEIKTVADYTRVPIIQQDDRVVYLGDVARVVDGHDEELTYSRVNFKPSVSISVKKRTGANILETARKVKEKVAQLEKGFPAGVRAVITADQGKFINQGFEIMSNSAITGLLIVIVVLYFAMGLRNSIITALSIPLSLLLTFILLKVFGLTNNNMVRFSLVLCIGLLVDNAIIVVENAYHHFQLGKDRLTSVKEGVAEIAMPVIAATLTTMAAFVPVLLMTGTTGEYMSFLPKTVNIALASSLIVALVATPLILSRFMKQTVVRGRVRRPEEDLAWMKKWYVALVTRAMNHRWLVLAFAFAALVWAGGVVGVDLGKVRQEKGRETAAAMAALGLGRVEVEMFPDIDFDYIYITIETPPGTDVEVTEAAAAKVEKIVRDNVPEAVRVVSTVGFRAASAFEIRVGEGPSSDYAEVTVELLDGKEYARPSHKEIQQRIRPMFNEIPGANIRFRPLAWGPPRFAPIVVKVVGPDLNVLRDITAKVKDILAHVPGSDDIKDDFSSAPPELRVEIDREKAARLGVPLEALATGLRAATAGLDVRDFRDELDVSRKYDFKVRFEPQARTSTEMLEKVMVRSAAGALAPLSNVARFRQGAGVNAIRHTDRRRVVRITAQNQGRSAVEISQEFYAKLQDLKLPAGYEFVYGGEYQETEESFASLKLAYLIAFLLIFALLVAQFNSYFQPFAIMTALPLSVVGAMFGLMITGNNFSIMSFVGLVGLTGIVVNDSIVLVDCINRYRRDGYGIFDAVVEAGQARLKPIMSTTVTTIGGIITLTITDQLWEGLGVVIIFGIGFATVLTLVVVPVMYSLFEGVGYQVTSAFRGPRWLDEPAGRRFFFTRRRWAWVWVVGLFLVQGALVLKAVPLFAPEFIAELRAVNIQAPTALKVFIEGLVFYLSLGFRALALMIMLMLPTWICLVILLNRRSADGNYLEVRDREFVLAMPAERSVIRVGDVTRLRFIPMWTRLFLSKQIVIQTGRRKIRIRNLVERAEAPRKVPFIKWLFSGPPAWGRAKRDTHALFDALARMKLAHAVRMENHRNGEAEEDEAA